MLRKYKISNFTIYSTSERSFLTWLGKPLGSRSLRCRSNYQRLNQALIHRMLREDVCFKMSKSIILFVFLSVDASKSNTTLHHFQVVLCYKASSVTRVCMCVHIHERLHVCECAVTLTAFMQCANICLECVSQHPNLSSITAQVR